MPHAPYKLYEFISLYALSLNKDGCVEWDNALDKDGYPSVSVNQKKVRANRLSLQVFLQRDLLPDEQACHRCDNPRCINPNHLFVGSNADNSADRDKKGRAASGARNGNSKYPDELVREVRDFFSETKNIKETMVKFPDIPRSTIEGWVYRGQRRAYYRKTA